MILQSMKVAPAKKSLLGMGGDVVVKLCETLASDQVFADNLFTSAPLVLNLLQRKIYFVGTLRGNRLAGCQLEDEKSLAKEVVHLLVLANHLVRSG